MMFALLVSSTLTPQHPFRNNLQCLHSIYPIVCFCFMIQATAEQIRLAQMIYDKNDSDFECKVNQVRGGGVPFKIPMCWGSLVSVVL